MGWVMRRGDICLVDLEPVRGNESNKQRPAVVVSNDRANKAAENFSRGVITVVPLTSNVARVHSFQVLIRAREAGLPRDSKAQAEQLRAVSVERIGPKIGRLPANRLIELEEAIRLHLQL